MRSPHQRTFCRSVFRKMLKAVMALRFETKKYKIGVMKQGMLRATMMVTARKMDEMRFLEQHVVLRTRNAHRISIVSPSDFVTARSRETGELALPYCLDVVRRRALYVCATDAEAAQSAAFYYLHLRQTAQHIVSVPFEHLPVLPRSSYGDPVFLFSPGRVGSTLVSRVLAEAGIASVSEPDFYTQVAHPLCQVALRPFRRSIEAAMWSLSDDLCTALGAAPVVKLRAECAAYPELFLRRPKAKTIVLLRDFESWSRSTAQVFGAHPGKAVRKYLAALRCYEILRQRSDCHLMRYEDWLHDPNAAATALGVFLGVTIGPEAVQRAFGRHSQAGTPLIRRQKPGWEAKWRGALVLWNSPRLVSARAGLDGPLAGA